jgi:hypothetical protein
MKLQPQEMLVLRHLASTGSISSVEANAVHKVRSLSRRITSINDALDYYVNEQGSGVPPNDNGTVPQIRKEYKRDATGQRYVRYHLDKDVAQKLLDRLSEAA